MDNISQNLILWEEKNSIEHLTTSGSKIDLEPTGSMNLIGREFALNEWRDITGQKISGIYKIINKINGKYYVGSSKNITCGTTCRWALHQKELSRHNHFNEYLQRSWHKHGESNFKFIIIELVEPIKEKLLKAEQYYLNIAKLEPTKCYNIAFEATGGEIMKNGVNCRLGYKHTEETKLKMRISATGRKMSASAKEKIRINNTGSNSHRYGKTHSDATKLKMSEARKRVLYDHTIYTFYNTITNTGFTGTRHQFALINCIKRRSTTDIINKIVLRLKSGWTIIQ